MDIEQAPHSHPHEEESHRLTYGEQALVKFCNLHFIVTTRPQLAKSAIRQDACELVSVCESGDIERCLELLDTVEGLKKFLPVLIEVAIESQSLLMVDQLLTHSLEVNRYQSTAELFVKMCGHKDPKVSQKSIQLLDKYRSIYKSAESLFKGALLLKSIKDSKEILDMQAKNLEQNPMLKGPCVEFLRAELDRRLPILTQTIAARDLIELFRQAVEQSELYQSFLEIIQSTSHTNMEGLLRKFIGLVFDIFCVVSTDTMTPNKKSEVALEVFDFFRLHHFLVQKLSEPPLFAELSVQLLKSQGKLCEAALQEVYNENPDSVLTLLETKVFAPENFLEIINVITATNDPFFLVDALEALTVNPSWSTLRGGFVNYFAEKMDFIRTRLLRCFPSMSELDSAPLAILFDNYKTNGLLEDVLQVEKMTLEDVAFQNIYQRVIHSVRGEFNDDGVWADFPLEAYEKITQTIFKAIQLTLFKTKHCEGQGAEVVHSALPDELPPESGRTDGIRVLCDLPTARESQRAGILASAVTEALAERQLTTLPEAYNENPYLALRMLNTQAYTSENLPSIMKFISSINDVQYLAEALEALVKNHCWPGLRESFLQRYERKMSSVREKLSSCFPSTSKMDSAPLITLLDEQVSNGLLSSVQQVKHMTLKDKAYREIYERVKSLVKGKVNDKGCWVELGDREHLLNTRRIIFAIQLSGFVGQYCWALDDEDFIDVQPFEGTGMLQPPPVLLSDAPLAEREGQPDLRLALGTVSRDLFSHERVSPSKKGPEADPGETACRFPIGAFDFEGHGFGTSNRASYIPSLGAEGSPPREGLRRQVVLVGPLPFEEGVGSGAAAPEAWGRADGQGPGFFR